MNKTIAGFLSRRQTIPNEIICECGHPESSHLDPDDDNYYDQLRKGFMCKAFSTPTCTCIWWKRNVKHHRARSS